MTTQNRKLQFYGQGYGSDPASITVVLNNNTIYSGTVPTINEPPVDKPVTDQVVLFTTDEISDINTDFEGTLPLITTVNSGVVLFGPIQSNYNAITPGLTGFTVVPEMINFGRVDQFSICYGGRPVNSDNNIDSRSSVYIDGVKQSTTSIGRWNWIIPAGSTMTCDLTITKGSSGQMFLENLIGTGTQTNFYLQNLFSELPITITSISVDSVVKTEGTDYTFNVAHQILSFTSAPGAGSVINLTWNT
jgi:hypothetical protein